MWLDNLQCNGNETTLADCAHNGWGVTSCSEAVSIVCENGTGTGKCHGCRGNPHTHRKTCGDTYRTLRHIHKLENHVSVLHCTVGSVTVTVTEALVLRPLLEDRGCITESMRILVPVNRIKLESVQLRRHCNSKATPTSRQSIWHIISIVCVFCSKILRFGKFRLATTNTDLLI